MIPAILIVTLLLCVLFVWRVGNRFRGLAILAAAAAAVIAVFLLQKPWLAALGLAAAVWVIFIPQRRDP
jgi:predicted branched-subunit amino acid permease